VNASQFLQKRAMVGQIGQDRTGWWQYLRRYLKKYLKKYLRNVFKQKPPQGRFCIFAYPLFRP
jgi:hypothetical protein